MQVSKLADALRAMEDRHKQHGAADPMLLGGGHLHGVLCAQDLEPVRHGGKVHVAADVLCTDTASIAHGKALVRTVRGSSAFNRTGCEHFVHVPCRDRNGKYHARVLKVQQLVRVHCKGKGWPDVTARIAVGQLSDAQPARGPGLEAAFNNNPQRGACTVPTILSVTKDAERRPFALHISQIAGPVVYLPPEKGRDKKVFVTFEKMGFHG
jgi:hypothetical protein